MIVNVQCEEASELLWDLFNLIPKDNVHREEIAKRVDRASALLSHPSLPDEDARVQIVSREAPAKEATEEDDLMGARGLISVLSLRADRRSGGALLWGKWAL